MMQPVREHWLKLGRLFCLGLLLAALCLPVTARAQLPGEAEETTAAETAGEGVLKSPTLRIGLFITICVLFLPVCLMLLYYMALGNTKMWPTTLFGMCLGLWGAICFSAFGWLFTHDFPLGDPNGPLGGYRLPILGAVVAAAWFLGAFFFYRRSSPMEAAA